MWHPRRRRKADLLSVLKQSSDREPRSRLPKRPREFWTDLMGCRSMRSWPGRCQTSSLQTSTFWLSVILFRYITLLMIDNCLPCVVIVTWLLSPTPLRLGLTQDSCQPTKGTITPTLETISVGSPPLPVHAALLLVNTCTCICSGKCLFLSGFTEKQLNYSHDQSLPEIYGIGLTNMVERTTPGSKDLSKWVWMLGTYIIKHI